jgi:predicted secreted protein
MKKFILPATFAIALFCAPVVQADDVKIKEQSGINVTLSASDQKKVTQDLLVASLRIEIDNKDSRKVQDDINKAMKTALDTVKAEPEIKVSTGSYYVYNFDPNPAPPKPLSADEMKKRMVWKGSQTIDLKSKDAQKALDILAKLQDMGFVMNGLNYTLSPELAEAQKDELLIGALKKIQNKAALVAKTLGKSGYEIADLTIDGSYVPQQPVAMMSMARDGIMEKSAMAAPVAAPSEDDVSLSVSARVVLKP